MPPLHFERAGSGPLIVLSHALGLDLSMWDAAAARLQASFTVLRYDHRCHGRSAVVPGPWSVEDLADDAAELIASQPEGQARAFIGLSMGGMTAQALAARHPGRVERLVIVNSSAHYPDRSPWSTRVATVREKGISAVADGAVERWLTPDFRRTAMGMEAAARLRATLLANTAEAYADSCEAVAAIDFRQTNRGLQLPTLVIAGAQDLATPPAMSEQIATAIVGARLETVDAAHISSVEQAEVLAELITRFAR
ncbi:alpha/beta fold hydrolase [Xylophilus rhododendri]|uniref:Alpha/beta fold hydrolase n=1 Tax=Xylophilus rhododendri TaxID=2697032 RepID=A0A857JC15_9BURK|nr:alpha/beta fold hydrolase [Xylophilus rhododendri]QHJ00630.1 alpha/beta fold hydrolase [Xylophilus rhododendri]